MRSRIMARRKTRSSRQQCVTGSSCWSPGFRFTKGDLTEGRVMRCPKCGSLDTQVKDSRPTEDSAAIRRRRVCLSCQFRFTTFERVQLRELTVIKRNGRRVPFDRDKLARSFEIALRKRNVEPEHIEQTVSQIVRELESLGESELSTERLGGTLIADLRATAPVPLGRSLRVILGGTD